MGIARVLLSSTLIGLFIALTVAGPVSKHGIEDALATLEELLDVAEDETDSRKGLEKLEDLEVDVEKLKAETRGVEQVEDDLKDKLEDVEEKARLLDELKTETKMVEDEKEDLNEVKNDLWDEALDVYSRIAAVRGVDENEDRFEDGAIDDLEDYKYMDYNDLGGHDDLGREYGDDDLDYDEDYKNVFTGPEQVNNGMKFDDNYGYDLDEDYKKDEQVNDAIKPNDTYVDDKKNAVQQKDEHEDLNRKLKDLETHTDDPKPKNSEDKDKKVGSGDGSAINIDDDATENKNDDYETSGDKKDQEEDADDEDEYFQDDLKDDPVEDEDEYFDDDTEGS